MGNFDICCPVKCVGRVSWALSGWNTLAQVLQRESMPVPALCKEEGSEEVSEGHLEPSCVLP